MAKLKPILFNTEMVKAILDGHKTETRRVIKQVSPDAKELDTLWPTPPYCIGDYLYVRETWLSGDNGQTKTFLYKASTYEDIELFGKPVKLKWKPSIHMPKEAARLFLKVENVSIERLQDIDLESVHNEGINHHLMYDDGSEMEEFAELWDSTTSDPQYKWENDPWVWVIQFKVVDRKEVESWLRENAE